MEENKVKQTLITNEEFRKMVYDAVFEQPMFSVMDLIQMGVVNKKHLKNLFSEELLKQL